MCIFTMQHHVLHIIFHSLLWERMRLHNLLIDIRSAFIKRQSVRGLALHCFAFRHPRAI